MKLNPSLAADWRGVADLVFGWSSLLTKIGESAVVDRPTYTFLKSKGKR